MTKLVVGLVALVVVALVLYVACRGDDDDVSVSEASFDAVHLCTPSQQEAATVVAELQEPSQPLPVDGAPYFAQNDPAWGDQEYDHGGSQGIGCGATIAQCGCAMTSVATVMHLFDVVSTPEGSGLDPATLNAWFNQGAQNTNGGWVSQGYSFGAVVWGAINGWTPERAGQAGSSERDPSLSRPEGVRFVGWGTGSEEEIRRELEAGRPVVLEVPGHYIAAVGLEGNDILINDPYYRERRTLDVYSREGKVLSSRLFEPSDDFRMITVTVPSDHRVEVRDESGRLVGTRSGDTPQDAVAQAETDISGSQYQYESAWRDPTCTERAPQPGTGVNTIYIPVPETGVYTVVVVNPEGDETSAVAYWSDIEGTHEMSSHDGRSRLEFEIDYDSGIDEPPTPTPTATVTETPEAPTAGPTESATEAPTATEVPSATPTPEAMVTVTIPDGEGSAYNWGDSFQVCYSANREMIVLLTAVSPAGARTTILNETAGVEPACISLIVEEGDPAGTWTLELRGEDDPVDVSYDDAIDEAMFRVLPPPTPTPEPMSIEVFDAEAYCAGPQGERYAEVLLAWRVTGDPLGSFSIAGGPPGGPSSVVRDGEPGVGIGLDGITIDRPSAGPYSYALTATNSAGLEATETADVSVPGCFSVD